MKQSILLFLLILLFGCASSKKEHIEASKSDRKNLYSLGIVYGPVVSVKEKTVNTVNDRKENNTFLFSENERKLTWLVDEKLFSTVYFDDKFLIDSAQSNSFESSETIIFYKYPVYEDYVHYSIRNGKKADSIIYELDTVTRSVKSFDRNKLSSINYFDKEGFLVRKESKDLKGEVFYTYNEYGHILKQEVSVNSSSLITTKEYEYEYDKRGNWTKRILKANPNGPSYTRVTERKIVYDE